MSDTSDVTKTTGHLYDGIQEYDNPTPSWWSWLFAGSVVFSLFYWLYFHSGVAGRSVVDQYNSAFADNLRRQFAEIGELTGSRAEMVKYSQDPRWLKVGEIVYATNCISCHGKDGGGIQGPNLTDDHFKNVKSIEDLATVIKVGANNGAMPAWQNRLHPNEVVLVACYVASMRGTSPASPKAPEGNVIPPWPTSADASETPAEEAAPAEPAPSATEGASAAESTEAGSGEGQKTDTDAIPIVGPSEGEGG